VVAPLYSRREVSDAEAAQESFLIVEARGELYAVRWGIVREAGVLLQSGIDVSTHTPTVERDGVEFPVVQLRELVGLSLPESAPEEISAVFLEEGESRVVLVPDRILWKQKASLEELPSWIKRAPAVAGAIALSSGVVVVVLEPLRWRPSEQKEDPNVAVA
jgi:chemotaxis protein histidine kinase CheA